MTVNLNISRPHLTGASGSFRDMTNIEQLRHSQQQRLIPSLALLNAARKNLEDAIALTEAREREYRELSEDVQRKVDAIDLVASMARELNGTADPQSRLPAPEDLSPKQSLIGPGKPDSSSDPESTEKLPVRSVRAVDSVAVISRPSRALFSFSRRSTLSRLSILQ